MNYDKLLGNIKRFYLKYDNNVKKLLTDGEDLSSISDSRFNNLLRLLYDNVNNNSGIYIEITKDGMKYNTERIKKEACKYFDILYDEDINELLKNIKYKENDLIDKGNDLNDFFYHLNEKDYSRYTKNILIHNYYLENKRVEEEREELNVFKQMCINEDRIKINDEVFDENKLSLYIAYNLIYKYLVKLKKPINDPEDLVKIEHLKDYIVNYSNSFKDYSLSGQNKVKEMILFLTELEKENKIINKHIKKYNHSFFESDDTLSHEKFYTMCRHGMNSDNSLELKALLQRKIDYYESLNFDELRIGRDSFSGYIGFRLDSGIVILDKFFENVKKGKIAEDNAVYIIDDEKDFEEITKLSKPKAMKLIREKAINAGRKVHNKNYENNINKYIEEVNNKRLIKTK